MTVEQSGPNGSLAERIVIQNRRLTHGMTMTREVDGMTLSVVGRIRVERIRDS